jgi:hypothetical protein
LPTFPRLLGCHPPPQRSTPPSQISRYHA